MRKILVVFNGVGYPTHVMHFAQQMIKDENTLLHAVFMKPKHVTDSLQYPFPNDLSITQDNITRGEQEKTDMQAIEDNKVVFMDECKANNIRYIIDNEIEIPLDELIIHSKFSDLVIADVKDDLGKYTISDLLTRSHCPVILVQMQTEIPTSILLAYDGSDDSIQAIKLYSYLVPEWKDLKTMLVQVNPENDSNVANEKYFHDWITLHFTNCETITLQGNVENEITNLLNNDTQRKMVVMGGHARKGLSALFHKSLTDRITEISHVSLFVAHS